MKDARAFAIRCVVACAVMLCYASTAVAQRGQTAELAGTVRDASGAVLDAVTLTTTSAELIGGEQRAETNARGWYRFDALLPGVYEVTAAAPGFKTLRHSGIELAPGLGLTVDFRLELAPLTEVVNVNLVVPAVDVRSSASPTVLDQQLLHNLPLDRTVSSYLNLAPGVSGGNSLFSGAAFGGSAYTANPLSLDGTDSNHRNWGGQVMAVPNANWIDQIQVVSLGANAQYGEYTGARINAITRSGSNRFSGLGEYWTTRPNWTANNRGSLPAALATQFQPIEVLEWWDANGQVGGPIVKDRLWFFSGVEYYRNAQRPFGFSNVPRTPNEPAARTEEPKLLVKLTGAPAPRLRLEGYVEYDTSRHTNTNAGPLVRPEALSRNDLPERMGNARLTWTLNDRTLLEARYGYYGAHSASGPTAPADRSGPPGHYDQFTNVSSVSSGYFADYVSRINSANVTLTRYVNLVAGKSHELKAGFEHEGASLVDDSGYPGGAKYFDYNGAPSLVHLWAGETHRPSQRRTSLFAQDTWLVSDRLTIEPGVRVGFYDSSAPVQSARFYRNSSISPRLGVAWDLTAEHRTVLRAHYGWYHEAMMLEDFDFLDYATNSTPTIVANVLGPGQFQEVTRSGGPAGQYTIDTQAKHPYVEEYFVGIQRELRAHLSASVQYIHRSFKDSLGFVDTGTTWTPVDVIDPGPDGIVGTAGDGRHMTVYYDHDPQSASLILTNPAGAWRDYNGVQVIGTRRYARGLEVQASYTWSRTRGNVNNDSGSNALDGNLGQNGNWVNPNFALFSGGRTSQDRTHDVKVIGTYLLRYWGGVQVSGIYRYSSGQPWARGADFGPLTHLCCGYLQVEPIGAHELPATNSADLRIEKTFAIGPAARVGIYGELFNVNNQGIAQRVNFQSGPNFALPVVWSDPRSLRVGLRVTF